MSGTILDTIVARKREEIAQRQRSRSLADLEARVRDAEPRRGFTEALQRTVANGASAVIAEIKKASPSKGVIRADFDPTAIARSYQAGGATCLSVLTDRDFFAGDDTFLQAARGAVGLPVLRKDFVVDPYQVLETRALGADCLLLIVAALTPTDLRELHDLGVSLGLDVLIEVHDEAELETALSLEPRLLGINNRDLRTFETSLDTTVRLVSRIPDHPRQDYPLVVTESGIHSRDDVAAMHEARVHAFLVGETFMRSADPGAALADLFRA